MMKNRRLNKESFSEFLGICFSCWLLAIGICLLVDVQFVNEFGVSVIACQTLISIVFTAAITRIWWMPIIFISAPVLVLSLLSLTNGSSAEYLSQAMDFVKWCAAGLSADSKFNTESNITIAHLLANVGITILLFAIERIFRKSWVTVLLSLVIIIVTYAFGFTQYNKIAILFFFVGALTLMALEEFNGHRMFKRGSVFKGIGYQWGINIISFILCFSIGAGALATLNNDKKTDIRNRFCSNIAADVQTATNFFTTEQQELDITLYDIGLQENKKYLGGSLPKLESRILAKTDLKRPTLLKLTTFDSYNGKKWYNDFEKSYRLNGPWEEEEQHLLSSKIAYNQEKYAILSNFYVKNDITVTLDASAYFLPTFEQTLGFTENTETKNPILFDKRGRLLSYFPQEKGFSYTLNSFSFDLTLPTDTQRRAIFDLIKQPDYNYTKAFREHYTRLSVALPQNVIKDIETLELKGRNPYYILQSILSYFSSFNGFSYEEDLSSIPNRTEICSTFFSQKKGHCVHYSTAIIAMLRYLDVPSRLAVGYRTSNNGKGVQVVNAANPHCWVECYLPNIGWISIDPTPNNISIGGVTVIPESQYKPPKKEDTPEPEPEIKEEKNPPIEDKTEQKPKDEEKRINYNKIFTYLFAILLLTYILLRGIWSTSVYNPTLVQRLFKSSELRAKIYWRGISRLLKYLGCKSLKQETIREHSQKVADSLTVQQNELLLKAVTACEEAFYSPKSFDRDSADTIYAAIAMLQKVCRKRLNPILYYLRLCLRPLF